MSKAVVLALHKRWRRLPPTKRSPSQVEGDCFYRRLVSAPVTLSDSRQPDRHSTPIALGPAQFNEFYRQCPPPKSFPLCGFFFWGRAPPIECSSLSVATGWHSVRRFISGTLGKKDAGQSTNRERRNPEASVARLRRPWRSWREIEGRPRVRRGLECRRRTPGRSV